jgi:hypothetical protein
LCCPPVNPDPSWIENTVYNIGKNLPPIRRAFVYILLKHPSNPDDDRPLFEEYLTNIDREIENATQEFERAEDPSEKAEWRMRVAVLNELKTRIIRLFRDRERVSIISLGRDLRESDHDPQFDQLLTEIMEKFNDNGIPHDIIPSLGFIVLEEDYDDALNIVVECVQAAMAKLVKGRRDVMFAKVIGLRKVKFPSSK